MYEDREVVLLKKGNEQIRLHLYVEAIKKYNEAIRVKPDFSNAFCNRGYAKHQLGLYEESLLDFDTAIEIDKQYTEAYKKRAKVYLKLKKQPEAMKDFETASLIEFEKRNNLNHQDRKPTHRIKKRLGLAVMIIASLYLYVLYVRYMPT